MMLPGPDASHLLVEQTAARLLPLAETTMLGRVEARLSEPDTAKGLPVLTVLPLGERAEPPRDGRKLEQRVTLTLGLFVAVSLKNDPGAARARASLGDILGAVRAELLGWRPDLAAEPIAWTGGRLADLTAGHALWQDTWAVVWQLNEERRRAAK